MIDRDNFKELYDEFKDLVYNLSLHYLQNKEESEDITQEVFIKLFKNIQHYDATASSLKTWIYRITINTCLDQIKSKKTKRRFAFITSIFSGHESIQLNSEFYHPGIQFEHKQALQRLLQQINQLPEQQKTALILTKIEDRSQQEVAEIMNISVKAVESLLSRAKINLKKKLQQSEG
jgi:RNA polymerase sigma factor (sigma-70 family)